MKVKSFLLVVALLSIGAMAVFPSALTAFTEEGVTVTLHRDGTWEKKVVEIKHKDIGVPTERNLFSLVIRERNAELYDHYLEHYEGVNLRNTIIVLFNKIMTMTMSMARPPAYKEALLKGVQYTYQYGVVFMLPWGAQNEMVSNLYFFWELANRFEDDKKYEEALSFYEKLKDIFVETGEMYPYDCMFGENSLEEIEGKIYKMNFLMSLQ